MRHGNILSLLLLSLLLATAPALGEDTARGRTGGSRWGANYFPNVPLTTHEGKPVRFFDDLIKDKVVAINFIYTSCPDVCPLESARLSELQAILGDRVGQDVFLYSITIDPEVDTPEVLARYAERFGAGPGWLFLTGDEDDIILLRKKLGLYRPEIQSEDSNDHNLSLIIGNQRTGRWMKRSPMDNPYFLAANIGGWLHNWKTPSQNRDSYANAPELRKLSTGESLFRTRCSSCHVIGRADEVPPHMRGRLLGPDLLNVTERRDRSWLARWLAEPDKMLAEEDPIAMELFAKHDRVSMPNFSLNGSDVIALLDYLETESRRVERLQAVEQAVPEARPDDGVPVRDIASCCQKDKAPVMSAQRTDAQPDSSARVEAVLEAEARVEEPQDRPRVASLLLSGGLGFVLLLLAFVFGKRPMSSG